MYSRRVIYNIDPLPSSWAVTDRGFSRFSYCLYGRHRHDNTTVLVFAVTDRNIRVTLNGCYKHTRIRPRPMLRGLESRTGLKCVLVTCAFTRIRIHLKHVQKPRAFLCIYRARNDRTPADLFVRSIYRSHLTYFYNAFTSV